MSSRKLLGHSGAATAVALAVLLFLEASPSQAFGPCDPSYGPCKETRLPWYRGDGDSKLRLRFDLGAAGILLKGPGSRGRVVELRFVIRF